MVRANLRKVGGSVMLAIPPAILDQLALAEGSGVDVTVEGDALMVRSRRPRYTLDQLLAEEHAARETEAEDVRSETWTRDGAIGEELI